jgi:hypothetical protein
MDSESLDNDFLAVRVQGAVVLGTGKSPPPASFLNIALDGGIAAKEIPWELQLLR